MILVFLGPPGSGKGTQAAKLAAELGIPSISTGDLFRAEIAKGSELGLEVKPLMEAGRLVPDSLVFRMLDNRILNPDCRNGLILDGYPRTTAQAELLDARLRVDKVILLEVPTQLIIDRMSTRLTCSKCNAIYNIKTVPPKHPGHCDRCNSVLVHREDQKPDIIRERLRVYDQQTAPLIRYYEQRNILVRIDADGSPNEVDRRIRAVI